MKGMGIKKYLMLMYWRVSVIDPIISAIFWAGTLGLLLFPYVNSTMLLITHNSYVNFALLVLGVGIFTLTLGIVYDKKLKLWNEANVVANERNPYALWKLPAREVYWWQFGYVPILRALGQKEEAEMLQGLINLNLSRDQSVRADFEKIVKEVKEYTPWSMDRKPL